MWYNGILNWSAWQLLAATLVLTHITIVSVTVYLHRYSAHRSLELHPALKHFFRFWLWLTTSMNTREWTAIHRKHHAKCETPDDPHSPVHKGLLTVLRKGAELYMEEAKNEETLRIYGKNCPDDWIERNLYQRFPLAGVTLMALIDIALFGALGITVWAVQMLWIPVLAAGVINGLGHAVGYRNFECRDAATNLLPWGILIGGEELHNNHHTYPNSAKLSVKKWEFDMGWMWIRLFSLLGLAEVRRTAPIAHKIRGKQTLDMDTAMAILNNRFQIMAQYRKHVIKPLVRSEIARLDDSMHHLFRRAKRLLSRETSLLDDRHQARIQAMLDHSQALKVIYEKRLALQQIWGRTSANSHEMLQALKDWCHQAEESGIKALQDFAWHLRSYSLRPNMA
ncbi:fatty acid desaturase [Halopseudomonas aestusnigri]|jgi:stearoyl-CoA desaturase (Delta-9 desaturase)|uniref:delta-9 fatty acid desaturase DesA n=1 Tax=Halopseudomonas aestusnigri TaxID=857252 RepID=UPI000C8D32A8|nr:delta-9 fatty acid desaturase DesA [Halopseudomonas aestusnigri]MAP76563.1 acyl-CoA desaturase [Pseudomonadales bacterium]MEE2799785.1 delta-9 fatty acid desaturase DesA [Pseudomonadota bacterium]HBT57230.1 acyl-CoA desaturase [Pseudomonas sp.]MAS65933.1 acyl-CoA desaturase [Pseudomonadales bacterium]MCC4260270.1 fatty acid desaturase [Halopseudomonas aestusnigri]|tara:strand:+ start:7953 stop:9137 length:1185 start_codon:yes stop_codon:yes gene_type:complete